MVVTIWTIHFIWISETGSGLELETLAKNDLELLALLPLLLNGGITGIHYHTWFMQYREQNQKIHSW